MDVPGASDSTESKLESKDLRIDIQGKGSCKIENMISSTVPSSDSTENKLESKELLIDIRGKGSCKIENMISPAVPSSDSTENKLESKELLIDIQGKVTFPTKKMVRPAAIKKIEGIFTCNELPIDIPKEMEPARWSESCIYKVPKKLRDVNKKAYSPKLISIGPLHHGQQELKEMELQKLKYFKEFFDRKRTRQITPMDLRNIIDENKEKTIRQCYATDTSKFKSKEFVNMILLDAIFIIELFLRNVTGLRKQNPVPSELLNLLSNIDGTDYMFSEKWLSYNLKQDLLLFENQIPFFILQELWEKSEHGKTSRNKEIFLSLAFTYFYELLPKHKQNPSQKEVNAEDQHFTRFQKYAGQSGENVKHFTDMLRYFFYPEESSKKEDGKCIKLETFSDKLGKILCFCSEDDESEDGGSIKHLYSATQLDEAGVKFKRVKNRPLLEIKFKKNQCLKFCPFLNCSWLLNCLPCFTCFKRMQPFLEVPTFEVNDETECVFRNLMAFEQCHPPPDSYICNYILLLDRLINSEKDVGLLVDERVIVNFLGSNQRVAALVNKLCLEIVEPDHSRYTVLSERLNKHYRNCWNKNMASLTRLYFGDIWRGTTTLVGFVVLVFTLWNFHRLLFE